MFANSDAGRPGAVIKALTDDKTTLWPFPYFNFTLLVSSVAAGRHFL